MVRKKVSYSKDLKMLLLINLSVIILLLSIFVLQHKNNREIKVLGVSTNNHYWEEVVTKHPTYIDGWIELERIDVVKQIDPNYPL